MRTDEKGGYVNYSDYLELKNQPDPLTAYLYAAELAKDEVKRLKAEFDEYRKAATIAADSMIDEQNRLKAEVERLKMEESKLLTLCETYEGDLERLIYVGDMLATMVSHCEVTGDAHRLMLELSAEWNAAKEGKQS